MREFDSFAFATEINSVFADDVAATYGVYTDFFARSGADETFTSMHDLLVVELVRVFEDLNESLSSPARCIFFVVMMHFKYLWLVVLT